MQADIFINLTTCAANTTQLIDKFAANAHNTTKQTNMLQAAQMTTEVFPGETKQ